MESYGTMTHFRVCTWTDPKLLDQEWEPSCTWGLLEEDTDSVTGFATSQRSGGDDVVD